MKRARVLFNAAAVAELLTGLALLARPEQVIPLLLGGVLDDVGTATARVLGLALVSLGVAALETSETPGPATRTGLCIYNSGAGVTLFVLGMAHGFDGVLLRPAAIIHTIAGIAMIGLILRSDWK